eukprot:4588547-Amphidinium_carterae.1
MVAWRADENETNGAEPTAHGLMGPLHPFGRPLYLNTPVRPLLVSKGSRVHIKSESIRLIPTLSEHAICMSMQTAAHGAEFSRTSSVRKR